MMMERSAELPAFLCCAEILPRLESVQISVLPQGTQFILSQESIYYVDTDSEAQPKMMKGNHCHITKCLFGPSRVNLTTPLDVRLAGGIIHFKLKTLSQSPQADVVTPPKDVLENFTDEPSSLGLQCSFCSCDLTKQDL